MVSRARSRASSSSGSKVIYYDPAGGRVFAVLAERDEEYERELTRTGNQWRSTSDVPADQTPGEGMNLAQCFVKVERDGKVSGLEVRS